MKQPTRLGYAWIPLLAMVVGATSAAAQDVSQEVTLRGEVRDFVTEQPIEGAVIQIANLGVSQVTDGNGYFEFGGLPAGDHMFVTASFGYETNREPSTIGPGNIMVVRLNPMAIRLPGISVEVESLLQQLETRRIMTASSSTVFDREAMQNSLSPNLSSYVSERAPNLNTFNNVNDQLCVNITAGSTPVLLRVFLDEAPVPNAFLVNLTPREMALVEVYPRLAMVRVYSQDFLDRAADAGYQPPPLVLVEEPRACY